MFALVGELDDPILDDVEAEMERRRHDTIRVVPSRGVRLSVYFNSGITAGWIESIDGRRTDLASIEGALCRVSRMPQPVEGAAFESNESIAALWAALMALRCNVINPPGTWGLMPVSDPAAIVPLAGDALEYAFDEGDIVPSAGQSTALLDPVSLAMTDGRLQIGPFRAVRFEPDEIRHLLVAGNELIDLSSASDDSAALSRAPFDRLRQALIARGIRLALVIVQLRDHRPLLLHCVTLWPQRQWFAHAQRAAASHVVDYLVSP